MSPIASTTQRYHVHQRKTNAPDRDAGNDHNRADRRPGSSGERPATSMTSTMDFTSSKICPSRGDGNEVRRVERRVRRIGREIADSFPWRCGCWRHFRSVGVGQLVDGGEAPRCPRGSGTAPRKDCAPFRFRPRRAASGLSVAGRRLDDDRRMLWACPTA